MGILIVPAVFGAGVYQISRFVDLAFYGVLPDGSITYMAMGDRVVVGADDLDKVRAVVDG